jgi:hypothetical protein
LVYRGTRFQTDEQEAKAYVGALYEIELLAEVRAVRKMMQAALTKRSSRK